MKTKQSILSRLFLNMYLRRSSRPCYNFTISSMLKEFRLIPCLDNNPTMVEISRFQTPTKFLPQIKKL